MASIRNLANELFGVLQRNRASGDDGTMALMIALQVTMIDRGLDREDALEVFQNFWDTLEPGVILELKKQGRR